MEERPRAVEDVVVIDPAFWRGRRVLVTGHTGFKGSWLTLWLSRLGADVVGLARDPVGRSLYVDADVARDCESHLVDIRDAAAVAGIVAAADAEIVFHLAAQALVRPSYADAADTWATNVMGTIHLLDALRAAPRTTAVVVVTSDKCYEHVAPAHPFVETDPLGGHDPYSSSKAAAEIAVASWRRSFFRASDVGVATARAGNVIGGGDWAIDRLIPDLARSVDGGPPASIRHPRARRPWQHVLEPLCGYLMLAQRLAEEPGRFGGAWNFGPFDGASLEVAQVAQAFSAAMGKRPTWEPAGDKSVHEAETLSLSSAKARDALGWAPLLSIDDAITWSANAYRAALFDGDQRGVVLGQIDAYARPATDAASPSSAARHEPVLVP